jgi:hypothetical protein
MRPVQWIVLLRAVLFVSVVLLGLFGFNLIAKAGALAGGCCGGMVDQGWLGLSLAD